MALGSDHDWEDGPSVIISTEAEEEAAEEAPPAPSEPPLREPAGRVESRRRSPFWVRLIYVLIFSTLVLSTLVTYALVSRDRTDRLVANQEALWAPLVESLENKVIDLEERLEALEERVDRIGLEPSQPAPPPKKKQ
jgi:hypothetical protein